MRKERHLFFMVLCCLIPVVAILALVAVGLGGWAVYGLFLLCPLMHILMMRGHKRTNCGEHNQKEE
ncbi:MAG: DUF2933 domain-containing protein [bacterium]